MAAYVQSTAAIVTKVDSLATAQAILVTNTAGARKGATISNTDANVLYLLLGGTGEVTATNFSVQIAALTGYYEVPFGFQGTVRGLWAVDGAGSAFVTEFF